jgi:ribosomal protein S18 acetylase RimI-like enzyme
MMRGRVVWVWVPVELRQGRTEQDGMTAVAERPGSIRSSTGLATGVASHPDAPILRQARLDAVRTSPEAFLTTITDLETKPDGHWRRELESSTWAVVEVDGKVCGIAAAKPPDLQSDSYAREEAACFIESVWIAPSIRQQGFGGQLIRYLIESQFKQGIEKFYLWVLDQNRSAIELYKRLGFRPTWRRLPLACAHDASAREIQYMLAFDSRSRFGDKLASNKAIRERHQREYGAHYRLLE